MIDEPGAPVSEEMAASEIRCIFYKLEMTQLNAQINEMLIQDERGERTDTEFLMRLLKRRQEIERLLNDERIGAVDVVMTQRLY